MDNLPATAYVGVGSNIRPEENVVRALEALEGASGVSLLGISTFYRTEALPDPNESISLLVDDVSEPDFDPDFLNGVLEIRTFLDPEALLALFHNIEERLGRQRTGEQYAPRTIDLDLLLFGRAAAGATDLDWMEVGIPGVLAHRDIERRAFVAHPLLELAPDLILPPYRTPLRAFAASFDTPGGRPETEFSGELRRRFLSS